MTFDPVMRDLDRHLNNQASLERLAEQSYEWVLHDPEDAEGYFEEDEWPKIRRIAADGETEPGDGDLWEKVMETYAERNSPW